MNARVDSARRRGRGIAPRLVRSFIILPLLGVALQVQGADDRRSVTGLASWYGEELRGKPMANGSPFNPNQFTAASWYYPLGTRVWVTLRSPSPRLPGVPPPRVLVTITDRGPAKHLVRQGRIIDLGHAAFQRLAPTSVGLVEVTLQRVPRRSAG